MIGQTHDELEEEPPETGQRESHSTGGTDTGRWKRIATALLGGALVLFGIRRRSLRGVVAVVAGGWLLNRGLRGGRSRSRTEVSDTAGRNRRDTGAPPDAPDVERSITVEKSPDELHERWRDPETHERIWAHFAQVESTGENGQHWTVGGPMGVTMEWDAEVVEDRPGELLRWESLDGATVPNEGTVRFEQRADDEETKVTLRVRFDPPGGTLGTAAMKRLDVVPDTVAGTALRRFKSLVETGEIPTLERNPSARGSGDLV